MITRCPNIDAHSESTFLSNNPFIPTGPAPSTPPFRERETDRQSIDRLRAKYVAKGPFPLAWILDRGLFSPEELQILETYGYWFQALADEEVPLVTDRQKMFFNAQKKGVEPKGKYGRLWYRYLVATEPPF